ncbi:MAG: hypothetical protein KAT70_02850, partial [Thermoplasmata archaeon]|nr:hypothetical protein [Thermoplasmata archaeon]
MSKMEPKKMPAADALEYLVGSHSESPTFLTVVKGTRTGRVMAKRPKDISHTLKGKEEAKIFLENLEVAEKYIEEREGEALALFVSVPHDLFVVVDLPREWEGERMVVDTSPYIRDLAESSDDWETYLLVVVDETSACIELVEMGRSLGQKCTSADIFHRHKKGGMSQRRYQRLREGAVDHYLKRVAEDVEEAAGESGVNRIILAGPGGGEKELQERLPKHIQDKVVAMVDLDPKQGGAVSSSLEAYFTEERSEEESLAAELRSAVMREEAVYGAGDVASAVYGGRARLLLVLHGCTRSGWRCEGCGMIGDGTTKDCPLCGHGTVSVDLVEETVEEAVKNDTRV